MGDLELKYAHLSDRDSPARKANRKTLQKHIAEIQAEQAKKSAALRGRAASGAPPTLRIADRYAHGRYAHSRAAKDRVLASRPRGES